MWQPQDAPHNEGCFAPVFLRPLSSCERLIEIAFDSGVHRIYAECDPENENSWRLLETLGFKRESHLRQNVYFRKDESGSPIWKDPYIYALLNQ